MGDIKAFCYGVLKWSEEQLNESSIDYFVYSCLGWNHNDLYQTQNTNNLNKRLAFAIAEIMTSTKSIKIDKYFELFEKPKEKNIAEKLNQASNYFPTELNGKK